MRSTSSLVKNVKLEENCWVLFKLISHETAMILQAILLRVTATAVNPFFSQAPPEGCSWHRGLQRSCRFCQCSYFSAVWHHLNCLAQREVLFPPCELLCRPIPALCRAAHTSHFWNRGSCQFPIMPFLLTSLMCISTVMGAAPVPGKSY